MHVYNMMMSFFLIVYIFCVSTREYTIILIPIPILHAHYVFRLLHEISDNIRSILFTFLFVSIDFFELIAPTQHTHARTYIPQSTEIFIYIFDLVYCGGFLFMHPYKGNERKLNRTIILSNVDVKLNVARVFVRERCRLSFHIS